MVGVLATALPAGSGLGGMAPGVAGPAELEEPLFFTLFEASSDWEERCRRFRSSSRPIGSLGRG